MAISHLSRVAILDELLPRLAARKPGEPKPRVFIMARVDAASSALHTCVLTYAAPLSCRASQARAKSEAASTICKARSHVRKTPDEWSFTATARCRIDNDARMQTPPCLFT